MKVEMIPIEKIYIPEERARATFTDEQTAELKASIQQHGFTVPILVAPMPDGRYMLIDGEHRVHIAKELGMTEVPAVITEGDEKRLSILNILANTARGTQNPADVAKMLKKAQEAGATLEELAAATGHTVQWVKKYLMLNELPDVYIQALKEGKLKVGHVEQALRLPTPQEIDACLSTAIHLGWDVETTKYYVENRLLTLEVAKTSKEYEHLLTPPSQEQAQQLVQYGECMLCHRMVDRKTLRLLQICPDCVNLLSYLLDQLGDPQTAMQTCFKALDFYFKFSPEFSAAAWPKQGEQKVSGITTQAKEIEANIDAIVDVILKKLEEKKKQQGGES